MDTNDYTTLHTTDDGESVLFVDEKVPVEYFLEIATGSYTSVIDGREVLLVPKSYNIHTLLGKYEKLKTGTQVYIDYPLTNDRRYLVFDSVPIPVEYIVREAPGTVIINDTIKIPSKYDTRYIFKKYNEVNDPKNTTTPVSDTHKILEDREKTHGNFRDHSYYTQALKSVIKESPNYDRMSEMQMEALDMIAHKIGRILAGNPDHKDHWLDIEGYARLISRNL